MGFAHDFQKLKTGKITRINEWTVCDGQHQKKPWQSNNIILSFIIPTKIIS